MMSESCSVCGIVPALCVDKRSKGTYFLCGNCMEEVIIEKIKLQEAIADFAERVDYEHKTYTKGKTYGCGIGGAFLGEEPR